MPGKNSASAVKAVSRIPARVPTPLLPAAVWGRTTMMHVAPSQAQRRGPLPGSALRKGKRAAPPHDKASPPRGDANAHIQKMSYHVDKDCAQLLLPVDG